jgi:hypothetical protein
MFIPQAVDRSHKRPSFSGSHRPGQGGRRPEPENNTVLTLVLSFSSGIDGNLRMPPKRTLKNQWGSAKIGDKKLCWIPLWPRPSRGPSLGMANRRLSVRRNLLAHKEQCLSFLFYPDFLLLHATRPTCKLQVSKSDEFWFARYIRVQWRFLAKLKFPPHWHFFILSSHAKFIARLMKY